MNTIATDTSTWNGMLHAAHVSHRLMCDTERVLGVPEGSLLYDNESAQKFWDVFSGAAARVGMETDFARKEFLRHHMFAAWYRYGRPTFDLGPGLVHQLADTSPGAARMVDLAWPFDVFLLTIPEKESPIYGWRKEGPSVRPVVHILCSVARRPSATKEQYEQMLVDPSLEDELSSGTQFKLKDALMVMAIGADANMNSVSRAMPGRLTERWDEWLALSPDTMRMTSTTDGLNMEKVDLNTEARQVAGRSIEALLRFVVCTALYLSPKNAEYAAARETQVRKKKTGIPLRFRAGHEVKIDPTRRERVITRGKDLAAESSSELAMWVRGHMQRYHFKKGGERVEWVPKEAYFKGLNPQEAVERKFAADVKPNKENE